MHLLIFGLGYTAFALSQGSSAAASPALREPCARQAGGRRCRGWQGSSASTARWVARHWNGAIERATHVLVSMPPDDTGDPVLRGMAQALAARRRDMDRLSLDHRGLRRLPRRLDRRDTPLRPTSRRSRWRSTAEKAWLALGAAAASACRSFASPASTGPAAAPSTAARGHGAAHRQAGAGVQPHPRRRYRGRGPAASSGRGAGQSTTSPTTSRRRRRT